MEKDRAAGTRYDVEKDKKLRSSKPREGGRYQGRLEKDSGAIKGPKEEGD